MYTAALFFCWILPELQRLEAFAVGCGLAVLITIGHVTILSQIMSWYRRKSQQLLASGKLSGVAPVFYFSVTILLMLLLHVFDSGFWGCVLWTMRLIPNIHDALYFSANTYTSLGYGNMVLSSDWRELSPLIAISGLFTFACTTGQLFNVMGYHRDNVDDLKAKREQKSSSA